MTDTPHLTAALAGDPIDLRDLDATLANLRRAERAVAAMVVYFAETRNSLAASPGDTEAARQIIMSRLRMRADAFALAQDFAALAQRDGAAP